jgi:hypothetical protein
MEKRSGIVSENFAVVFAGYKWASSTYYKHKGAWESIQKGEDAEEKSRLARAVDRGKAPGGEWKVFLP